MQTNRKNFTTTQDYFIDIAKDPSFWILLFSHLSVVGLVWFNGWHPLTLLWIYISQQVVQSLLDVFLLLFNPKLDVTGFGINGKPATDSKADRRSSAAAVLMMVLMMGLFVFYFSVTGLGIPKGAFPIIVSSIGIFTFQKLFSYFYIRLMDGPQNMDMGCLVIGPVMSFLLLAFLFLFGHFVYLFPGIENPLSITNIFFLVFFVILKLLYDLLVFLAGKYGTHNESVSS